LQITDRLGRLAQRVRPIDDRRDLAGSDELLEDDHGLVVLLRDERRQLVAREPAEHERPELAIGAPDPPSAGPASDDDEGPPWGEGAPEARQRRVAAGVEDRVVALLPLGEVVACGRAGVVLALLLAGPQPHPSLNIEVKAIICPRGV
jgi:hypothetical protein